VFETQNEKFLRKT